MGGWVESYSILKTQNYFEVVVWNELYTGFESRGLQGEYEYWEDL